MESERLRLTPAMVRKGLRKLKYTCLLIGGAVVCLSVVTGCKPVLTQKSAGRIIPDGMDEPGVLKVLGTNGRVSVGSHGEKYLMYVFPFFDPPPGVKPGVDIVTIILSNGVVVGRYFGERLH
jgi:hypothetical protein